MKTLYSEGFKVSDLFLFDDLESIVSPETNIPVLLFGEYPDNYISVLCLINSAHSDVDMNMLEAKGIFSGSQIPGDMNRYIRNQLKHPFQVNPAIMNQITQKLNLVFDNDNLSEGNVCFANDGSLRPEFRQSFSFSEVLDYCYAVLNSPSFLAKFIGGLKDESPVIPYPRDDSSFFRLAELGKTLRKNNFYKDSLPEKTMCRLIGGGTNRIEEIKYRDERVYINSSQYFSNVIPEAWNFEAGLCFPAQKWLNDRIETILKPLHIREYYKLIFTLAGSVIITSRIDEVYLKQ